MATPLPLLSVTPNAGNAAPALLTSAGGVAAGVPSDGEGLFAALIARQFAIEGTAAPTNVKDALTNGAADASASLASAVSDASASLPSASGMVEAASAISAPNEPDPTTAALARSVAATLIEAGEPAPVVVAPPEDDAAKASVIVVNEAPVPPPDEAALTDAAGGEDIAPDALNAAFGAALSLGVVPLQGERLIQSAVLPTAVRNASSVRILDQLLDKLRISPPAMPSGEVQPDAAGAVASSGFSLNRPMPAPQADITPSLQPQFTPAPGQNLPATAQREGLSQTLHADAWNADRSRLPQVEITPGQPAATKTDETAAFVPTNAKAVESASKALPTANGEADTAALSRSTQLEAEIARVVKNPIQSDKAGSDDATATVRVSAAHERDIRVSEVDSELSFRLAATPNGRADTAQITVAGNAPTALAAVAAGSSFGTGPMSSANGGSGAQPNSPGAAPSGLAIVTLGSENPSFADHGSDFLMSGEDAAAFDLSGLNAGSHDTVDDTGTFGTLLALGNNAGVQLKSASATLPHHVQPPMMPPNEVAVHIAAAARDGARNLTIQLQPAALGRIDVELSVNREGKVKARIQAERSETLDLLQRDARGLERALEAAGLKAETGGLSFSLKDGGRQDRQPMPGSLPRDLVMADVSSEPIVASRHAYRGAFDGNRALDIEV